MSVYSPAFGGMARLSWPEWVVKYKNGARTQLKPANDHPSQYQDDQDQHTTTMPNCHLGCTKDSENHHLSKYHLLMQLSKLYSD